LLLQQQPAAFRCVVPSIQRPIASIVVDYINHPYVFRVFYFDSRDFAVSRESVLRGSDPLLRGNLFELLGSIVKASLEQQDGEFGTVPPLQGAAMSLQELEADSKESDHKSCLSPILLV
jgi:hypothetical protein